MATDPTAAYRGPRFRLTDICDAAGVSPSTINNWRRAGLLPSAVRQGRHSWYDQAYLDRLRQIVRLKEANRTLLDIRDHLDPEPDEDPDDPEP